MALGKNGTDLFSLYPSPYALLRFYPMGVRGFGGARGPAGGRSRLLKALWAPALQRDVGTVETLLNRAFGNVLYSPIHACLN